MVLTFKVYKKTAPNGKLTVYLSKRDYVDHIKFVDPIEGVVLIDDEYLKGRKIYGQVVATFRYGRQEDEVMGLNFFKELYLCSDIVYPKSAEAYAKEENNKMQNRLLKKLGPNAFSFRLDIPLDAPQSVTIQASQEDSSAPCGVHYDVKLFVGDSPEDRNHKRSTVRLGIRKIQWAQIKETRQPTSIIRKDFLLSPGEMELEATLQRQVFHPGEEIPVNIVIRNHSNKTVKSIRVTAIQNIDVCMFASGHYNITIGKLETQDGCPVTPGASIQKTITLTPSFDYRQQHRGVALDGQIKNEDTSLASSTLIMDQDHKDLFGIIISYSIKVKLLLGALGGEVNAELPYILMRPRPKKMPVREDSEEPDLGIERFRSSRENTVDLDDGVTEDPEKIIFEDFARLRLNAGVGNTE